MTLDGHLHLTLAERTVTRPAIRQLGHALRAVADTPSRT